VEQFDDDHFKYNLQQILRDNPHDPVPVLFEGSVYARPLIARMWYTAKVRLGLSGPQTPNYSIVVTSYKVVEAQTWDSNRHDCK
jgi:hypothetical protein